VRVLVSGLRRPHGLLLEGDRLIVAEVDKVTRITFADGWRETAREPSSQACPPMAAIRTAGPGSTISPARSTGSAPTEGGAGTKSGKQPHAPPGFTP
jgi:hypothetical protein